MVRKIFILFAFLGLLFASSVYSAVELDADDNGATDIDKGGTNTQDGSISATKTSGVPGYSYWYEADTTNTLTTGFQGPADLSVNISHVMPSSAGTAGQVFEIDTVQTSQTLPNGETGTLVTLKNGDKGSGTGGYVATPTYSDDTCTTGQYSWDASYYYGCESTDQWDRYAVTWTNWSNPTPTIPTMTSATIPSAGTTVSLLFSEAITIGSGGNGGWTLNTPTNAMTYSSGDTTDTLIYTLASTINSTDTPTITYTQPGDGLENSTGGDLASIVAGAVVNNSTQVPGLAPDFYFNCDSITDQQSPTIGTGPITVGSSVTLGTGIVSGAFDSNGVAYTGNMVIPEANLSWAGEVTVGFYVYINTASGEIISKSSTALRLQHQYDDFWVFAYASAGVGADILSGGWRFIEVSWSNTTDTRSIRVDGGTWADDSTAFGTLPTGDLEIAGEGSATDMLYDQVFIENSFKADLYSIRNSTSF